MDKEFEELTLSQIPGAMFAGRVSFSYDELTREVYVDAITLGTDGGMRTITGQSKGFYLELYCMLRAKLLDQFASDIGSMIPKEDRFDPTREYGTWRR